MIFEIKFSNQSTKFIRNLSNNIQARIKKKFIEISENPFRYLEHFEGENFYKLRIGDYRSLIDVDFEKKILFVRVLDKRGRICKR